MKLAELLAHKGSNTVTVAETASVAAAITVMQENRVGSVIIPSSSGVPAGIFTERDVVRLCAEGKAEELQNLKISDCMTRDVMVASPDQRVDEALNLMTNQRFRRLPIVENDKLIGLVSIGDLVKAKLQEYEQEAQSLREYIVS